MDQTSRLIKLIAPKMEGLIQRQLEWAGLVRLPRAAFKRRESQMPTWATLALQPFAVRLCVEHIPDMVQRIAEMMVRNREALRNMHYFTVLRDASYRANWRTLLFCY
jgi:hypothetical protein